MLKVRAANPMRTNVVSTIPPVFPEARSAFSSGGRGPAVYQIRGKEVTSLRGVVAVAIPIAIRSSVKSRPFSSTGALSRSRIYHVKSG
jgi:hypothetical protein